VRLWRLHDEMIRYKWLPTHWTHHTTSSLSSLSIAFIFHLTQQLSSQIYISIDSFDIILLLLWLCRKPLFRLEYKAHTSHTHTPSAAAAVIVWFLKLLFSGLMLSYYQNHKTTGGYLGIQNSRHGCSHILIFFWLTRYETNIKNGSHFVFNELLQQMLK